jgi:CubicO group peptidase (beta-lactamase class C family)
MTAAPGLTVSASCERVFATGKFPGVAVAVRRPGADDETLYLGKANVEKGTPVGPETVFRIGSVGKTMTAIGVMQQVEAGRLQLDAPVNDHLRHFKVTVPAGARPVTVMDLLTHTSGIGPLRRTSDLFLPQAGLGARTGMVREPAALYRGGLRAVAEPGTRWSYANHGFNTLGQLIADVSGTPYREYMTREVFLPLGMVHTSLRLTDHLRKHLAVGYRATRKGMLPVKYTDIVVEAAGAVFSTPAEMVLYLEAMLGAGGNRHGRVLRPETFAEMTRVRYSAGDPIGSGFGLGFMVASLEGHRNFWHSGGWPGFSTMLQVFPEEGIALVGFTNTMSVEFSGLMTEAARVALGMAPKPAPITQSRVDSELAAAVAGSYGPPEGLLKAPIRWLTTAAGGFKVIRRDGGLHIRGRLPVGGSAKPAPMRLDREDPLVFSADIGGQPQVLNFTRDARGKVSGMNLDGVIRFRKL